MTNRHQQAAARRDARSDRGTPQVGKHRSGKDTKRWCCGVVGREHQPKCVPCGTMRLPNGVNVYDDWRNYQCTACGKVLARYMPLRLKLIDGSELPVESPPEWVDC